MFTSPFCAECERARALLERLGIEFEEIDLGRDAERCCALEQLTGGKSTPQLVLDGRPIGGYRELVALVRSGQPDGLPPGSPVPP